MIDQTGDKRGMVLHVFFDGVNWGIDTNADNEEAFIESISELMAGMIGSGFFMFASKNKGQLNFDFVEQNIGEDPQCVFANNWAEPLAGLLPLIAELCIKMREMPPPPAMAPALEDDYRQVVEQRFLRVGGEDMDRRKPFADLYGMWNKRDYFDYFNRGHEDQDQSADT